MLYEIIAIARPGSLADVREIVLSTGQLILRNGGVIRDIKNWGVFRLPKTISRHQVQYTKGHYFIMRYDSSIAAHLEVKNTLAVDPRVIRSGGVKLGDGKLEGVMKFGEIPWGRFE